MSIEELTAEYEQEINNCERWIARLEKDIEEQHHHQKAHLQLTLASYKPKPAPAPKPTRHPLNKKHLAAIILYVDLSTEYSTEAYVKRTLSADRMNPDQLYAKLATIGYTWRRGAWRQKAI